MSWRWDGAGEAAWNMACDECLEQEAAGSNQLLLRGYTWQRPALSIGYFTRWREVEGLAPSQPVVRRLTGGGIVEHGRDYTFSVWVPAGAEAGRLSGREVYSWLHGALVEAMGTGGRLHAGSAPSNATAGGLCFENPVAADVIGAAGEKIAGGAMRRTRAGILYQGSVHVTGLGREFTGRLANAIAGGAAEEREARDGEAIAAIEALADDRYADAAWLKRR